MQKEKKAVIQLKKLTRGKNRGKKPTSEETKEEKKGIDTLNLRCAGKKSSKRGKQKG